jgi:hypothetical protein
VAHPLMLRAIAAAKKKHDRIDELFAEVLHSGFVQTRGDNSETLLIDPLLERIRGVRIAQNYVRYS